MAIVVLTETELRQCVSIDQEGIQVVSEGFSALARGEAVMPPILSLDVAEHHGEVDIKTAYIKRFDSFAIKISSGFFDNPKLGLPSLSGMMALLSAQTGQLEALLLDNGYLTDVRTAIAGAIAAKHLAREDCHKVGVIGAGLQARLQIEALRRVRNFERLLVWARDTRKAQTYAEEMTTRLGIEVQVADSPETVVRQSDIVVTTTPARDAIVFADWLHPGLHITAMGSDAEYKNELDPKVLAQADRFICDRRTQSLRLGELHHAVDAGILPADIAVDELGEITSGMKPGRQQDNHVTVCDLTGTGVQDTAIALHAYRKAAQRGFGTIIEV